MGPSTTMVGVEPSRLALSGKIVSAKRLEQDEDVIILAERQASIGEDENDGLFGEDMPPTTKRRTTAKKSRSKKKKKKTS